MGINDLSIKLEVSDSSLFTRYDTIRVVGVKGLFEEKGNAYPTNNAQGLVLCVCGRDPNSNMPIVYAVNGAKDIHGRPIVVPAIPKGTRLVRMGKACVEGGTITDFNNSPTYKEQYCQSFIIPIEHSTIKKITSKDTKWNFSEQERDQIQEKRLVQENTLLFGVKSKIIHPKEEVAYHTEGLWYQAGKDIQVGSYNKATGQTEVSEEELFNILKTLFSGTKRKQVLLFCGSKLISTLSDIQSDRFALKDVDERWGLQFKLYTTVFGDILVMHHNLFDVNGMAGCGLAIDPKFLRKSIYRPWGKGILELEQATETRTSGMVGIQEIACLYLLYPRAHARLRLAQYS